MLSLADALGGNCAWPAAILPCSVFAVATPILPATGKNPRLPQIKVRAVLSFFRALVSNQQREQPPCTSLAQPRRRTDQRRNPLPPKLNASKQPTPISPSSVFPPLRGDQPTSYPRNSRPLSSPSRTISELNGVDATSSPYEAGTAHTGQPLKDSARSSTVRVIRICARRVSIFLATLRA
jgi:hypothetical protein